MSASDGNRFDPAWHSAALKRVAEGLSRDEPIIVVAGPRRAGKSTLCRRIADREQTHTLVALLSSPPSSAAEFLRAVLAAFGVATRPQAGATVAIEALRDTLRRFIAGLAAVRARCFIVMDDAHRLPEEVFDEIRLVAQLSQKGRSLVSVVLVGQIAQTSFEPVSAPRRATSDLAPPRVAIDRWSRRTAWPRLAAVAAVAVIVSAMAWPAVKTRPLASPKSESAPMVAGTSGQQSRVDPNWADSVVRRAVTLAQRPDVTSLLSLREEVAAKAAGSNGAAISGVLRQVDDQLDQARRRQLEIDHRLLVNEPPTTR